MLEDIAWDRLFGAGIILAAEGTLVRAHTLPSRIMYIGGCILS